MSQKSLPKIVWEAIRSWIGGETFRIAAALSFYAAISLAPLVTLILAAASLVYGEQALRGEIETQIRTFVGEAGAEVIQDIIANAKRSGAGFAGILSLIMLGVGATAVVVQLQQALNSTWKVAPKPGSSFTGLIRQRVISILLVFGLSLVLVAAAVARAGVEVLAEVSPHVGRLEAILAIPIEFVVATGLFSVLFKVLPDAIIRWREALIGGAVTALLFEVGRFGLGIYFATAAPGSPYGASGSLIALLLWIFYTALIFLLGAEFAQVYARERGEAIRPKPHAISTATGNAGAAPEPERSPNPSERSAPAARANPQEGRPGSPR